MIGLHRSATGEPQTPKRRGQRPSTAPGRRDLVTRGRFRLPTIRCRLIRLPLPLSLSVDRANRIAHRGGLPRCGHRRALRAYAPGYLPRMLRPTLRARLRSLPVLVRIPSKAAQTAERLSEPNPHVAGGV